MPFLSIVIPCYKVQAYLEECLDSVLAQGFRDIEVIGVNDRSPDHSAEILDAYAREDCRLRVVHLDQNVGLGPARNAGLQYATGEYVMFLDSDDALTTDALDHIVDKLSKSEMPDMLLLDHAREYWWGKVQRNIRTDVLEDLSQEPFTAEGHPEVFRLLQVAWNKVCRRDFLEREDLSFPDGYYEDTLWTHKGILTARSIAALPYVCVRYRQRRHGSILGSPSRRHFEAFDQWTRVFEFLDTRPDLDHWRPLFAQRMTAHYLTILRKEHRIAPRDRREFFERASEHVRRFGFEQSHLEESPPDRMLHRVLRDGNYQQYTALRKANRAQRAVRTSASTAVNRVKRLRSRTKTAIKLMEYRWLQDRPLDSKLAIYASLWNRGVVGNPKAIFEAASRLAPDIKGVWVIRQGREDAVPAGVDYVVPGTRRYWQLMARAKYFINDVNFPDEIVKRPGQVHLQTQHGTPLKHMGIDLMQHPAAANGMNFRNLLKRSDRWDYNISSNTFSTLTWERAFPSNFTTLESGYPRNDRLVRATAEDVFAARSALDLPATKTAVLYAPTHRDYDKHLMVRLDLANLARDLGDDFIILVRAHYFYRWMPEVEELEKQGLLLNVSQHPDVEELMLASDLLVTDYSSIMFDYANLGRPIVIYAPDWEVYHDVRGVYFDLTADAPGPVSYTQEELSDVLTSRTWAQPGAESQLESFRRRFCEFDDGLASERVVRRVFLDEPMLPMLPYDARPTAPAPSNVNLDGIGGLGPGAREYAAEDGEPCDPARVETEAEEEAAADRGVEQ